MRIKFDFLWGGALRSLPGLAFFFSIMIIHKRRRLEPGSQSARRPSSRGFVNKSVIAQRISRNPSGVADGLRSGFELDKGRHGGMIERHGKYAKSRKNKK